MEGLGWGQGACIHKLQSPQLTARTQAAEDSQISHSFHSGFVTYWLSDLGKWLHLSEPRFPICPMQIIRTGVLWESPEIMSLQLFYKVETLEETFYYSYNSPTFGCLPTCFLGMSFSLLKVKDSLISQMGLWAYSRASKKCCADYMIDSLIWHINRQRKTVSCCLSPLRKPALAIGKRTFSWKKDWAIGMDPLDFSCQSKYCEASREW